MRTLAQSFSQSPSTRAERRAGSQRISLTLTACWLMCWLCAAITVSAQTPGHVDPTFNPGGTANVNNDVLSFALQSDGKIVIGGAFSSVGATSRNRIARLNSNGTLDPTFDPGFGVGTGSSQAVIAVALQTDGKVIVGGYFNVVGTVPRGNIARLTATGGLDTSFDPGSGTDDEVGSVAVQSDGKVLIGGSFNTVNGTTRHLLARLNANGSLDTTFNTSGMVDGSIYCLAVQADGKILIGGDYYTDDSDTVRNRLARLNADGSPDTTFHPGTAPNDGVHSMAVQADGKIIIGGYFTSVNGTTRQHIARLNADGTLDTAFDPGDGPNYGVDALTPQGNGKIIIGGSFGSVDGVTHSLVVRLNADGSLDSGFDTNFVTLGSVFSVALQPDGKVLFCGSFGTGDGSYPSNVARLYGGDAAAAPAVTAGGADTVQAGSAVVHASVNPQGSSTSVSFQYGPTTSYGSATSAQSIGAGSSAVAVSATLSGLTPGTLYHYRVVATNGVGTTNGADATFTTLSIAQDWRQQYFGTSANTGDAADGADPDGDGIVNLVERALGLNPKQASIAGLPVVAKDSSTGRLMLTASKGASASDLTFSAEASSDLVDWTISGVTVLVNTSTTFQARDDGPATASRYLRLRVTAP